MEELYKSVSELLQGNATTDASRIEARVEELAERAAASNKSDAEVASLLESWIVQYPQRSQEWFGVDAAIADLDRLLSGPNSTPAKVWNRVRQLAGWCIEHYVAVASLVTVFATLFYGFAYTLFFRDLDITAEQAGMTPPLLLTRSALGGLALTLILALLFYVNAVPYIPIREDRAAREERGSVWATLLNIVFTLLGCLYLAWIFHHLGLPWMPALVLSAFPALPLPFISFRWSRPGSRFSPNLRPLEFDIEKYITAFAPMLLIGLVAAAFATIFYAERLGSEAQDGWAIREPSIFGLPFIGVRVEPVLVQWREGAPTGPHLPRCLLRVGSSGDRTYLYDHRSGRTMEVQSDAVTLEFRNRAETCDAPLNEALPTIHEMKDGDLRCSPGSWYAWTPSFYQYQWINEGLLFNHSSRGFRIFHIRGNGEIRCRVIARNFYGEDIAVSKPFAKDIKVTKTYVTPAGHRRAKQ
jgi:hypothetical protein